MLFHGAIVLRPPCAEVTLQALQACLLQGPPGTMYSQPVRLHGWEVGSQLKGGAPDVSPDHVIGLRGCGHVPGADVRVLQAVGRDGLRAARPAVTTTTESEQHAVLPSLSNSSLPDKSSPQTR